MSEGQRCFVAFLFSIFLIAWFSVLLYKDGLLKQGILERALEVWRMFQEAQGAVAKLWAIMIGWTVLTNGGVRVIFSLLILFLLVGIGAVCGVPSLQFLFEFFRKVARSL